MPDADQLKTYLVDRDVRCPGCGYNLRGVQEPACPECEEKISIDILKARESTAGWIGRRTKHPARIARLSWIGLTYFTIVVSCVFWIAHIVPRFDPLDLYGIRERVAIVETIAMTIFLGVFLMRKRLYRWRKAIALVVNPVVVLALQYLLIIVVSVLDLMAG